MEQIEPVKTKNKQILPLILIGLGIIVCFIPLLGYLFGGILLTLGVGFLFLRPAERKPVYIAAIIGLIVSVIAGLVLELFFSDFLSTFILSGSELGTIFVAVYFAFCIILISIFVGAVISAVKNKYIVIIIIFVILLAVLFVLAHIIQQPSLSTVHHNIGYGFFKMVRGDDLERFSDLKAEYLEYNSECEPTCALNISKINSPIVKEEAYDECINNLKGCSLDTRDSCEEIAEININNKWNRTTPVAYKCFMSINKKAINSAFCDMIVEEDKVDAELCKEHAQNNLAIKTGNYDLCLSGECKVEIAIRKFDSEKCRLFSAEEVGDYNKMNCLFSIDYELIDFDYCANMTEASSIRAECLAIASYNKAITSTYGWCAEDFPNAPFIKRFIKDWGRFYNRATIACTQPQEISDCKDEKYVNLQAYCYTTIARRNKDESICEYVLDDAQGKDSCFFEAARSKKDETICLKIIDDQVIKMCFHWLAREKKDPAVCHNMDGQNQIDECYRDVAIASQDSSICDNIDAINKKIHCKAATEENPDLCLTITYPQVKQVEDAYIDWCLGEFVETGDETLCEKMINQDAKDLCYNKMASIHLDKKFCEKVAQEFRRNDCYLVLARNAADPELCEPITKEELKTTCISHAEYNAKEIITK